jgi:hypothetical protein
MPELEICPFCQGKATFVATSTISGYISCIGECKIKTAKFWDEPMTEPANERTKWYYAASKAWNRRSKK